jgi:hypothetical protein
MSELTPELMNTGIILSYISVGINFIIFFVFYFSKSRNNSILASLFMLMSLCECIGNYVHAVIYQDLAITVNHYNIRKIFTFLTFRGNYETDEIFDSYKASGKLSLWESNDMLSPSFLTIIRVNHSIYSSVFTFALFLNLFYRLEVVCILKYPISNWWKRHIVYLSVSYIFSFISFITSYFVDFEDSSEYGYITYKSIYTKLIQSQLFNGIIVILVVIASIVSIVYVLLLFLSKSRFYSKERLFFGMKHLVYMILYSLLYLYSDISLAINSENNIIVLFFNTG